MRCIEPVSDMLVLHLASEIVPNLFAIGKLHEVRYRTSLL